VGWLDRQQAITGDNLPHLSLQVVRSIIPIDSKGCTTSPRLTMKYEVPNRAVMVSAGQSFLWTKQNLTHPLWSWVNPRLAYLQCGVEVV